MSEKQKNEALKRMKILKLHKNAINDFKKGKLNFSEWVGALYWVDGDEKAAKVLADFEKEFPDHVPYHMIHNNTEFGEIWSILYVSPYEEEWAEEDSEIEDGYAFSYVYNASEPLFSEFGSILIKPSFGGLMRVG